MRFEKKTTVPTYLTNECFNSIHCSWPAIKYISKLQINKIRFHECQCIYINRLDFFSISTTKHNTAQQIVLETCLKRALNSYEFNMIVSREIPIKWTFQWNLQVYFTLISQYLRLNVFTWNPLHTKLFWWTLVIFLNEHFYVKHVNVFMWNHVKITCNIAWTSQKYSPKTQLPAPYNF